MTNVKPKFLSLYNLCGYFYVFIKCYGIPLNFMEQKQKFLCALSV